MDDILHAQFERVEAALSTLVDSIATFNPSPQAAVDLKAADDELCHGLDQLSRHQANQVRILALRSEADRLEAQLRSSVGTLASLRHELLEAAPSVSPADVRSVPSSELLQYANFISQYTVPPTFREPIPKGATEAAVDKDKDDTASSGPPTNGVGSPAIVSTSALATTEEAAKPENEPEAPMEVTVQQAEWLKTMREQGVQWVPWPSDIKIRSGNLMEIQRLLDRKKDPWVERPPQEQEPDHGDQGELPFREPDHRPPYEEPTQRRDTAAAQPPAEAPRVFQGFVDYDDDD